MIESFRAIEWEPIKSCPEGVAVEAWVEQPDGGYRLPFPVAWIARRYEELVVHTIVTHVWGPAWWNIEGPEPVGLIVAPSYWRRWPERVSAVFVTPELPRRQAGVRSLSKIPVAEQLAEIEALAEDFRWARDNREAPEWKTFHVLKMIASRLRGQLPGAAGEAATALRRRHDEMERLRTLLGAEVGFMQEMVGRWPAILHALEQVAAEEESHV
jgi:hypothetical protein